MSVKQLEEETSCKILIRGKGSVRDSKREERLNGRRGWEHLEEPLHVLITSYAVHSKAEQNIESAAKKIEQMLTPNDNGIGRKGSDRFGVCCGSARLFFRRTQTEAVDGVGDYQWDLSACNEALAPQKFRIHFLLRLICYNHCFSHPTPLVLCDQLCSPKSVKFLFTEKPQMRCILLSPHQLTDRWNLWPSIFDYCDVPVYVDETT